MLFFRHCLQDMYCALWEAVRKVIKRLENWEAAYFTVEASLILPMVMLVTVMMIFLAFYSYDRCILEHSAYEAALRGTGIHQTAEEAEEQVRSAAGRLVDGKLFAIHDLNYDIEVDAGKVTVNYHCVVNMPFMTWLGEYVSGADMTLNISGSAVRFRPARIIRDCRILNRLIPDSYE